VQLRRYGEAIAVLREGARRSADDPVMLNALAWLLATAPDAKDRNGAEAERVARALCVQTSHRDARALSTLAAALAELGRFDEAVQAADAAREAALSQPDAALAKQIEQMQGLYRTGRAYRQPP
jgi:Flp pilus assembly protein TadD